MTHVSTTHSRPPIGDSECLSGFQLVRYATDAQWEDLQRLGVIAEPFLKEYFNTRPLFADRSELGQSLELLLFVKARHDAYICENLFHPGFALDINIFLWSLLYQGVIDRQRKSMISTMQIGGVQ